MGGWNLVMGVEVFFSTHILFIFLLEFSALRRFGVCVCVQGLIVGGAMYGSEKWFLPKIHEIRKLSIKTLALD